jgi:hypothetical protein
VLRDFAQIFRQFAQAGATSSSLAGHYASIGDGKDDGRCDHGDSRSQMALASRRGPLRNAHNRKTGDRIELAGGSKGHNHPKCEFELYQKKLPEIRLCSKPADRSR